MKSGIDPSPPALEILLRGFSLLTHNAAEPSLPLFLVFFNERRDLKRELNFSRFDLKVKNPPQALFLEEKGVGPQGFYQKPRITTLWCLKTVLRGT
jgi:hypothetical protein